MKSPQSHAKSHEDEAQGHRQSAEVDALGVGDVHRKDIAARGHQGAGAQK